MIVAINVVRIRRLLVWGAVVLPAAAIAAALVVHGWAAQRFLAFYVAPLFLAAPLWVRLRLEAKSIEWNGRTIVDIAVLVLSFLRFVLGEILPFSGHMLFLVYSGLTTRERWYQLLGLVLLIETTVFKLWLWRDRYSWGLGLALGLLAALVVRMRPSRPAI